MKNVKKIMGFLGIVIMVPCVSFADGLLKLLVWEGYAPIAKVMQFEEAMGKKYGKSVHLEVSTKSFDPQEFF